MEVFSSLNATQLFTAADFYTCDTVWIGYNTHAIHLSTYLYLKIKKNRLSANEFPHIRQQVKISRAREEA